MTSMPQTEMTPNLPVAVSSPVVLGGIDTHKDLHVAAVIDAGEKVLGTLMALAESAQMCSAKVLSGGRVEAASS